MPLASWMAAATDWPELVAPSRRLLRHVESCKVDVWRTLDVLRFPKYMPQR
jgi:hypothetical protein